MSVYVGGCGAVSPAGWGVEAMAAAVEKNIRLEPQALERTGWEGPLRLRTVPAPVPRPSFSAHARLRRASPLSQYAAGAVVEALEPVRNAMGGKRIGLLCCLQSGPVQYACRFYEEVLKDPSTASPLLFPETVFSAPASHIAALLADIPVAATLLGDPAMFLQALAIGAGWLESGSMDACIVMAGEEFNWIHANAVWHLDSKTILGAGAGAVLLTRDRELSMGVRLEAITDAHLYTPEVSVARAVELMRGQLPAGIREELLCDSRGGPARMDRAEANAWRDWSGARISPKPILGEGLMAGAAWQVALAVNELRRGTFPAANVSVAGVNHQAIGARFVSEPA